MGAGRIIAAATLVLGGCALVSGASDLTVGDVDAGRGTLPTPDAAFDVVPPKDAGADTTVDAAPDGGSRLKDITFENNGLTHPLTGADELTGSPGLEGVGDAIADKYSMVASLEPSYFTENFTSAPEIFVSFLIEVDPVSSNGVFRIFRLLSDNAATSVDLDISGIARNVLLSQGGAALGTGGTIPSDDSVYRVGVHTRQGTGNGVLEVFVTTDNGAFGTAVLNRMDLNIGSMSRLQMGIVSGAGAKMSFDNIRIDTASMPAP